MGSIMIVVLFLLGALVSFLAGWWIHWSVGIVLGMVLVISIGTLILRARRGATPPAGTCPPGGTPPTGTPPPAPPMTTWDKVGMVMGMVGFVVLITAFLIISGMVFRSCQHLVDSFSQPVVAPTATTIPGFGTLGQIPSGSTEQFSGKEIFNGWMEPGQRIDLQEVEATQDNQVECLVFWETCGTAVLKTRIFRPNENIGWNMLEPQFCGKKLAIWTTGLHQLQMLEGAEAQNVRVVVLPR